MQETNNIPLITIKLLDMETLKYKVIKNKTQYNGNQSSRNAKEITQEELKKLWEMKRRFIY